MGVGNRGVTVVFISIAGLDVLTVIRPVTVSQAFAK